MLRMISGFCALGLLGGAYVVCPEALKQRIHDRLTPSEETLARMQDGFDALADHLRGPEGVPAEVIPASAVAE
jgi:hypothetical protein